MLPSPRLKSLLVRDFRSISGEWHVPLDANVILVHGQNGAGKTSLLSALELAATGEISYLDRIGDAEYRSHLHHRGTKSGQVNLETVDLAGRNSGAALVTAVGADCQPLLGDRLAEAFVERCFLPQATLGRLFEVYAPKVNLHVETPLMRFVKEVLGLDSLDALIDGLYSSGHMRRIERLSTGWREANQRAEELSGLERTAVTARSAASNLVAALTSDLASRLEVAGPGDIQVHVLFAEVDALAATRAAEDAESTRTREAHLRLDAVEAALTQGDLKDVDPSQLESESGIRAAQGRYEDWKGGRSQALHRWFESSQGRAGLDDDPEPATLLRALRSEIADIEDALADLRARQGALRELDERSVEARQRFDELERNIDALLEAQNALSTDSAAASLASVLVSVLEHLDGEACPICDQEFEGVGSLRDHIIAKADALNAGAKRLLEMETRRSAMVSEHKSLAADLSDHQARRERLGNAARLDAEVQTRAGRLGELRSLEPIGEAGQLLADEVARWREAEAASIRTLALLDRCLTDLDDIADVLGTTSPRGLAGQRVAALRATARGRLDELEGGQRRVADMLRLRTELSDALDHLERADDRVSELQRAITRLQTEIDEAKRRKEVASRLCKSAEALRTATITSVFDDHLNGSWAHIFGALAPSEPFIPRFKHIPEGSRQVTVDIETVHRDGTEAATPAAMLSQGTLNTAALSLFVALHFAVPAELPWLIFDDPVQSMDDLHVSNFAAMVKQLTRRNGRQVVIAVHERELFDYLALELAPASPGEEVLAISLDRTYGRTVIRHDRVGYREDTALTPSPAA